MSWLRALIVIAAVALVTPAEARPGGGQTYSGSSSSSSSSSRSSGSSSYSGSGSSSSGGGDIGALIVLLIEYPPLGLFVLGLIAVVAYARFREKERSWESRQGPLQTTETIEQELEQTQKARRQSELRAALEAIVVHDPNFSVVLFEDFLYALYAEAHTARGNHTLERLSAWVGPVASRQLAKQGEGIDVSGIVVGAMRYLAVQGVQAASTEIVIRVEFESNYTEQTSDGKTHRYYAVEQWLLARSKAARSKPTNQARLTSCPNCGAPLEALRGRECSYCKKIVDSGEFDWVVREINTRREPRAPSLAGHAPEQGTDLPTVVDPNAKQRWEGLTQKDPALSWEAFVARAELVFAKLQESWNAQDLVAVRPYVSDAVFQTFSYWIDAYQRQKLRNYTEDARVVSIRIARVTSDAVYDSVTIRLFATGLDYTLDREAKVVGGSRDEERRYSEYWTLIRGESKRGAPRTDPNCPNCGAPLQIEMTGHCAHCRVKVTSGDFDWVLSRIEQDDSY